MTACEQLAQLQAQMVLLMSGQAPVAIETPQLGRVEFTQANIGNVQRLIDQLAYQCALENGDYLAACRSRRRPINLEAWP
jgi:gpW